ncbi:MAG: hypothetical protein MO852_15890, partial [Candidatus Devosia euplotis]|nr:hypothetical protein [Candidatus Devosia euplotis]
MGWGARLRTVITSLKGISIMDLRLPIGAAAIALLVLPLSYQLYSTTSMTPAEHALERSDAVSASPEPVAEVRPSQEADTISSSGAPSASSPLAKTQLELAPLAELPPMPMAPSPLSGSVAGAEGWARAESPENRAWMTPSPAQDNFASSAAMAPARDMAGDTFTSFDEQRLNVAAEEPVSTFS